MAPLVIAALDLTTPERLQGGLLHAVAAGYSFFLGATIGSFLNVVIYRMPRGLNIVRPRSRCPVCATPVALRDNIPVLSWLLLRGRCRCCAAPISPRYLLVEIAVGLLFVALLYAEVLSGGANLPFRAPKPFRGHLTIHWAFMGDLLAIALVHAWLCVALLAGALIQLDGLRVPKRWWLLPMGGGLLLPVLWPALRPLPQAWWPLISEPHMGQLAYSIFGLAVGSLLACALNLSIDPRVDFSQQRQWTTAAICLIATFLGWQPALTIACIAAAMNLLLKISNRRGRESGRQFTSLWFFLATALYIPLWKVMAQAAFVPGYGTSWPAVALTLLAVAITQRAIRHLR